MLLLSFCGPVTLKVRRAPGYEISEFVCAKRRKIFLSRQRQGNFGAIIDRLNSYFLLLGRVEAIQFRFMSFLLSGSSLINASLAASMKRKPRRKLPGITRQPKTDKLFVFADLRDNSMNKKGLRSKILQKQKSRDPARSLVSGASFRVLCRCGSLDCSSCNKENIHPSGPPPVRPCAPKPKPQRKSKLQRPGVTIWTDCEDGFVSAASPREARRRRRRRKGLSARVKTLRPVSVGPPHTEVESSAVSPATPVTTPRPKKTRDRVAAPVAPWVSPRVQALKKQQLVAACSGSPEEKAVPGTLPRGLESPATMNRKSTLKSFTARISSAGSDRDIGALNNVWAAFRDTGVDGDQYIFNAAIAAFGKCGDADTAVSLLREMPMRKIKRNLFSFTSSMLACERVGRYRTILALHSELKAVGIHLGGFGNRLVLSAHARVGGWNDAKAHFDEMLRVGCQVNAAHCSAVLSSLRFSAGDQQSAGARAMKLLDVMQTHSIDRDAAVYTTAISGMEPAAQWKAVEKLIVRMRDHDGLQLNTITCNAALNVYAKAGQLEAALCLYEEMRAAGTECNARTFHSLATACSKSRASDRAIDLAREAIRLGVKCDTLMLTELINSVAKCGRWRKVIWLFDLFKREGVKANIVTIGAALSACEAQGEWQCALHLFDRAEILGLKHNATTFTSVMRAVVRGGQWKLALEKFAEMGSRGVHPDAGACCALIEACRPGRRCRAATKAYRAARERKTDPIDGATASRACLKLLQLYVLAGKWKLAEKLLRWESKRPNGGVCDADCYSTVLSCLCKLGKLEQARLVWEKLDESCHREIISKGGLKGVEYEALGIARLARAEER